MSYKNYSNFLNKEKKEDSNFQETVVNTEEIIESKDEEIFEDLNQVNDELQKDTKNIVGVVDRTDKLYVRKDSSKESDPLCIIDRASELMIDIANSTDDFYKVITSEGVEGYCMKKFITIK